jgi:regulator of sigma D
VPRISIKNNSLDYFNLANLYVSSVDYLNAFLCFGGPFLDDWYSKKNISHKEAIEQLKAKAYWAFCSIDDEPKQRFEDWIESILAKGGFHEKKAPTLEQRNRAVEVDPTNATANQLLICLVYAHSDEDFNSFWNVLIAMNWIELDYELDKLFDDFNVVTILSKKAAKTLNKILIENRSKKEPKIIKFQEWVSMQIPPHKELAILWHAPKVRNIDFYMTHICPILLKTLSKNQGQNQDYSELGYFLTKDNDSGNKSSSSSILRAFLNDSYTPKLVSYVGFAFKKYLKKEKIKQERKNIVELKSIPETFYEPKIDEVFESERVAIEKVYGATSMFEYMRIVEIANIDQQTVRYLMEFAGKTQKDVEQIMNIPYNKVHSLRSNGTKHYKNILAENKSELSNNYLKLFGAESIFWLSFDDFRTVFKFTNVMEEIMSLQSRLQKLIYSNQKNNTEQVMIFKDSLPVVMSLYVCRKNNWKEDSIQCQNIGEQSINFVNELLERTKLLLERLVEILEKP